MKRLILFFLLVPMLSIARPALNSWNGIAYAIENYMDDNANDPESIEIIRCSVLIEFTNGSYAQMVKYRGANAYGGKVVNEQIFMMRERNGEVQVTDVISVAEMDRQLADRSLVIKAKYNVNGYAGK